MLALVAGLNADDDDRRRARPARRCRSSIDEARRDGARSTRSRTWTASTRSTRASCTSARRHVRPGDAARDHGAARRVRGPDSRARARSSSAARRSSASRSAMLLLQANATVTICHSRTEDLGRHTRDADILVAAVGLAGRHHAGHGEAGRDRDRRRASTRTDAGLVGDVDPGAAEVAGLLTPVPGGVGPMTIALLLANTVRAARYRRGVLAFPRRRTLRLRARSVRVRRLGARAVACCSKEERWHRAPSSGSPTRRATASSSARVARTSSCTSRRSRWRATSR